MRLLWSISDFGRAMHRQLRFGELSRAPLRLLRLEWRGEFAECDWMARPADEWDRDLARNVRDRNASEQTLRDAMDVRALLFHLFPEVEAASLRVFRESAGGTHELIITGAASRGEKVPRKISSTAMRAKLLGFQFWLHDGNLESLQSEECAMSL